MIKATIPKNIDELSIILIGDITTQSYEINILHSNANKLFIRIISHKKNCTMINELIFQKGSENKKLKIYFLELETSSFI